MFTPNRASCTDCERYYQVVKKTTAPCIPNEECPFGKPHLLMGNHLAWDIYNQCSSQVIVAGMGEVLGIKFEAIQFIFDIYEIKNAETRRDIFEKITLIDTIRIKAKNGEIRAKNNQSKVKSQK